MSAVNMHFHRPSVARFGDEIPNGRLPDLQRNQVLQIQRGGKSVRRNPGADAFGKNVPVHQEIRIEVRPQGTIVFGIDPAQIGAQPRHAAAAIGQQNQ